MEFIILLLLLGLAVYFIGFYGKKRKNIPAKFPEKWKAVLQSKVQFYDALDTSDRLKFEQDVLDFLGYCSITGIGFEPNDEDKLLVAASAVIPIFGFPDWQYTNLNEVLLYPNSFNEHFETSGENRKIGGMVGSGAMNRTMILSRKSLYQGFENESSKSNVGIHEFIHLIDMMDGAVDGIPELLLQRQYSIPWIKMIHEKTREIVKGKSDINPYGSTNEAEFLSVVSEYFFKRPKLLERKHPELYNLLEQVFKQDPADV